MDTKINLYTNQIFQYRGKKAIAFSLEKTTKTEITATSTIPLTITKAEEVIEREFRTEIILVETTRTTSN